MKNVSWKWWTRVCRLVNLNGLAQLRTWHFEVLCLRLVDYHLVDENFAKCLTKSMFMSRVLSLDVCQHIDTEVSMRVFNLAAKS